MADQGPNDDGFHASYESAIPDPDGRWATEPDGPHWSGPTPVMERALELVQADVDAAGLGHFRLSFAQAGWNLDRPVVNVQWRGTWTSDSLDLDAADLASATVDVASQLAQGLIELEGLYLPTCPTHAKRASAILSHRHAAVWMCSKSGVTPHIIAQVGELERIPTKLRNKGPLWRRLADLGRPEVAPPDRAAKPRSSAHSPRHIRSCYWISTPSGRIQLREPTTLDSRFLAHEGSVYTGVLRTARPARTMQHVRMLAGRL